MRRNRGPVAGHPFAAGEGGMEWYGRGQVGSIKNGRPRYRGRGQTENDLAPGRAGTLGCSRRSVQATDVAVAKAVLDQRE